MNINVVVNEDSGFTVPFSVLKLVLLIVNSLRRAERRGAENLCAVENIYPVPAMPEQDAGAYKIQAIKIIRALPQHNYDLRESKDIVVFAIEHEGAITAMAEIV